MPLYSKLNKEGYAECIHQSSRIMGVILEFCLPQLLYFSSGPELVCSVPLSPQMSSFCLLNLRHLLEKARERNFISNQFGV